MKPAVLLAALLVCAVPATAAPQSSQRGSQAPASTDKAANAYEQFLLARHFEDDHVDKAIAAYERAMELDPRSAEVPAALAALYLRQNRVQDAMATAQQAITIDQGNREANRVLGLIFAAIAEGGRGGGTRGRGNQAGSSTAAADIAKAIHHLELAIAGPVDTHDPNVRATLGRLYLTTKEFDKAIPLLTALVSQEPQWQDGPLLLAEAFAGSGRNEDAIDWLKERTADDPRLLPALADFYEREHRWADAANAYEQAVRGAPRSADLNALRTRYASALLNSGNRDAAEKARSALNEVLSARPTDGQALYLLSQAERRVGDLDAAEKTARRVIAQDSKSPWGYYALAETLEQRHQYQAIVDELTPPVAEFRTRAGATAFERGLLLPHLGFAYQELGDAEKAVASFEEARQAAPKDSSIAAYLIEAYIGARKYAAAIDLARAASSDHPGDLRLARLEAQALRHDGKTDQGATLLEQAAKQHADDPTAYIALAQYYAEVDRGPQALRVLQDAQAKFPADNSIAFELGAVFDKQKRFTDAEAAFRELLKRDPENAPALNYLGYMLAERGERLDESVGLLKKALEMEPENGSYLDSLGWAYFKEEKLDLAEDNLKRAADQQKNNSVIQDHYADVLFKLGRYQDAIVAWTRALNGDGDSVNRGDIDKKIKTAKQKLPKK